MRAWRHLLPVLAIAGAAAFLSPVPAGSIPEGTLPPPEGTPECPEAIAGTVLHDSSFGSFMTPDESRVSIHCSYLAAGWDTTPRFDSGSGTYRPWGSADISIDIAPQRREPCPADAGEREYSEDVWTWPSGLAGSAPIGDGSLVSATHHASLSWHFLEEDGVTGSLVEGVAMDLYSQALEVAASCVPEEPDQPLGPPMCPAAIGDYVLYEPLNDLEPQLRESETRPDFLVSDCEYYPAYWPGEPSWSDYTFRLRVGWIDQPVGPEHAPDPGASCTEGLVRIDRDDDLYRDESSTHLIRVTGSGPGGDPGAMEAAMGAILGDLAAVATPCPGVVEPEQPEPSEESGPGEDTEQPGSCAPEGFVTDQAGRPMPGLRVRLFLSGEVADQRVTDEDGYYRFSDLDFLAEAYDFDAAADEYEVGVLMRDAVEGAARFRIRYGTEGVVPDLRRGPQKVEDDPQCRHDFGFDDVGGEYRVEAGPADADHWRSLAFAYQALRRAQDFAVEHLGTELVTTPVDVYLYCSGNPPGTHGGACGANPAYWRGGYTTDAEPAGPPFIAFNRPTSDRWSGGERPINGEYHEYGHALMADAFGGFMPQWPDSTNHVGYSNPASTDSWTEGFAEWFATQVARFEDGVSRWWLYPVGGQVVSLEDDLAVTDNQGRSEELAIAGVLVDMVDGDSDYSAPTSRQLTVVSAGFFPNPDDPAEELIGVEVRNDSGIEQRDVAVGGDFGAPGLIGRITTRVDGIVDPEVLRPGETGLAVIRVPRSYRAADLDTVRVVGLGVGDDDGVTRTPAEVWAAILAYRSTSEHSKGHVMNSFELYQALTAAFPGDAPTIEAIFRAHGVFADTAPRNGAWDPGEQVGLTSPDGSTLRREVQPAEVFEAVIDAAGRDAEVLVQVIYPEPRDALSYAYRAVPGPDGAISVAVPPARTAAVVRMVVSAEGRLPALLPDLHSGDFWEQAEAAGYEPFLTYSVDLPEGDPLADGLPSIGEGGPEGPGGFPATLVVGLVLAVGVAAGTGVWWFRRPRPAAGPAGASPVPPPTEPAPPPAEDGPAPPPMEE